MSFYDFPSPSDLTVKHVRETPHEKLEELISHVQLKMEKLMSYGGTSSPHVSHCESLIKEARSIISNRESG